MRKIVNATLITALVVLFTGCNDKNSSDSSSPVANIPTITKMQKGVPVEIQAKDSIVNTSEDAQIEILVVGDKKTATLINDGNASILRP